MRMVIRDRGDALELIDQATSVDCQKDVRCWKSLRSVMELMIPCCGCQSTNTNDHADDAVQLKVMRSILVGAGRVIMENNSHHHEGDLMYMRATYKRVVGSSDSESFHLINPDGSTRQELSIFLLRS